MIRNSSMSTPLGNEIAKIENGIASSIKSEFQDAHIHIARNKINKIIPQTDAKQKSRVSCTTRHVDGDISTLERKNPGSSLENSRQTGSEHEEFKCPQCERVFKYSFGYRRHITTVHKLVDANGPIGHCYFCEKVFFHVNERQSHLKDSHNVNQKLSHGKLITEADMLSNINDSSNYCCACDRTLTTKKLYEKHIETIHRIMLLKPITLVKKRFFSSKVMSSDASIPKFFCSPCGKSFVREVNYNSHLSLVHDDSSSQSKPISLKLDPEVKPKVVADIVGPRNYCKVCKVTFGVTWVFRNHLKTKHNVELTYTTSN